jgi:FAD/FMN-containing dehydrogenase
VWNQLAPERRPDVIVRVASVPDVVAAVDFARGHGLRLAVRSGGHAWCGAALRDGGMLVDVANLDAIQIDGPRATAAIGPGAVSLDLAQRLARDRFAFPLGHCGSVRVGGYLLGGGVGWNAGAWGPACAGIEAVDVVTAEGRLLRATADEHPICSGPRVAAVSSSAARRSASTCDSGDCHARSSPARSYTPSTPRKPSRTSLTGQRSIWRRTSRAPSC